MKKSKFMLQYPSFNNIALTAFHDLKDFQDPTTGTVRVYRRLVVLLESLSRAVGGKVEVVSGFRTPEYNATLPDGHKNSAHLYGMAADIRAAGVPHDDLAELAKAVGFPRVKVYPSVPGKRLGWVHVGFNEVAAEDRK